MKVARPEEMNPVHAEAAKNTTFLSGGVARDAIREISGVLEGYGSLGATRVIATAGTFFSKGAGDFLGFPFENLYTGTDIGFAAGLKVPTGNENSVRTLSNRWWRRVA